MPELEPLYLEEPAEISARELRAPFTDGLQEGVLNAGDLKVSAGSGRAIVVAAGVGYVKGDYVTGPGVDQGLYRCAADSSVGSDAFELGGIVTADLTNPRIDQIVARLLDDAHDSLGAQKWRLEVLTGTPTGGATLDNRTGAQALPLSCLRLADVIVGAGAASIVAGNIRDRRTWAKGGYWSPIPTSVDSPAPGIIGAVLPQFTVTGEFSGAPVEVQWDAAMTHPTAGVQVGCYVQRDGTPFGDRLQRLEAASAANQPVIVAAHAVLQDMVAGRHSIALWAVSASGTGAVHDLRRSFTVREVLRALSQQS